MLLQYLLMRPTTIKVTQIGNSRGIRLPARILKKYHIGEVVEIEEKADEIILRPPLDQKLSWADTFNEMKREQEDWSDWEGTAGDGLDAL